MNTTTTIRSAQTLIMYNRMGSCRGVHFAAGSLLSDIIATAQATHDRSVENSSDNYGRDIFSRPRLVSDATGKELRQIEIIRRQCTPRCDVHTLSPRQREVFNLRHLSNEEIAIRIGCSPASVENYRGQAEYRAAQTERITA